MSGDTIIVRPGTVEDYPDARAVIVEAFAFHQHQAPEFFRATDDPPPSRAAIEELLRDGQGAWFLAEQDGQIVGYVTVHLPPAPDESFLVPEVRAHVEGLGVLAAWRRRGIGRQLMEAAQQWAGERGARRVTLNIWSFNDEALRLYESLGYAPFSHRLWKAL
jgi:ribosomal protein S18 acetylase RimI-like enzyme